MGHRVALRVGMKREAVHLAVVDLRALLVIGVDQAAHHLARLVPLAQRERRVRQIGGNALVLCGRTLAQVEHGRKLRVGLSLLVRLRGRGARIRQAVGAWERAEDMIEAAVLHVENHDVFDALEAGGRHGGGGPGGRNHGGLRLLSGRWR